MSKRYARWLLAAKIVMDALLVNLAFFIAYKVRYHLQWFEELNPNTSHPTGSSSPVPWAWLPSCSS